MRRIKKINEFENFDYHLIGEINLNFKRGSIFASILGFLCLLAMLIFILNKVERDLFECFWAGFFGLYFLLIFFIASKNKIGKINQYFIFIPLIIFPLIAFIIRSSIFPEVRESYLVEKSMPYYFLMIIISGFFFNHKLSILTGLLTGIEFFSMFLVGKPHLMQMIKDDSYLGNIIMNPSYYFFQSFSMMFGGIIIGLLSITMKKLINNFLKEEKEKHSIDKLFGQFVSHDIKNKIINEKKDIIGERKNVAVMFSDIRSFSSLSESLSPESIVLQLNQYFDKMVNCVASNGGTVDKFIGDGMMCVFGGLIELDNPCDSAIKAACMMRGELQTLNSNWENKSFPQFDIGIGIHYGDVLQGTIGSKERKEFTVIGDTVNTASRLESVTKDFDYKIIFSDVVYGELSDEIKAKSVSLGSVNVKGKKKNISIFGVSSLT